MAAAKTPRSAAYRLLAVVAALATGCLIGAAGFGVGYSEMPAYLSTDPEVCTNCHVMQDNYDSWAKGRHKTSTCDDCHLPHNNLPSQLAVQLEDGVLHGYKFTTGRYPVNITIRQSSLDVVNSNCVRCHGGMVSAIRAIDGNGDINCARCHTDIGHM